MNLLQNFPIGQYVPGHSFIHRLDPRCKLLYVLIFAVLVFMANDGLSYAILALFTLLIMKGSSISYRYILRGLKPVWFLLALTFLLHVLMTKGGTVYLAWGWLTVEAEGVRQAVFISVRLALLALFSSLLTLTTSPLELADGLERLLHPLSRVGVPVHEIALMLTIALRFIPTLLDETDKIIKAQASRGIDFETGGLWKRLRNLVAIVVPLFVSAFRRAEELALAMEARGYRGGEGRTKLRQLRFTWRDLLAFGIALILFAVIGWVRR
ncbi:energy-coupling factor transporter transmembrane component T family protein [Brevibacillus fulvus]|uniref:Energy-coupling factor transporter transmembrane protein EcfT n=1 Tax=Brevibacillus fulvus TaxID=1125967 RepID=A0A938Y5J9_9BACL|nr:energy-coupling factor transporter transmembrane component T [Brevibacillus fulvus]MBM7591972.1 energy-coupling factor transport system permease protein [Brevibacillus fulvus]